MSHDISALPQSTRTKISRFRFPSSILISVSLLILIVGIALAVTGQLLWQDQFDLADQSDGASLVATQDDRIFVAGWGVDSDAVWLIKTYAENGSLLWQDQFSVAGSSLSPPRAIAVQGRYLFVGGMALGDWLILAYDSRNGSLLWQDQFDLAGDFDFVRAIAVQRGRVFVAGTGRKTSGETIGLARAYDIKHGSLLWQNQFVMVDGQANFLDMVVLQQQIYVVGSVQNAEGNRDWLVLSYKAEDGSLLWQEQFDLAQGQDEANAIVAQEGQLFVAGLGVNSDLNRDWLVRSYNAESGALLWQDQFDLAGEFDIARDIAVKDGRVFVAGVSGTSNGPSNSDGLVRVYDSQTGSLIWQNQFDLTASDNGDEFIGDGFDVIAVHRRQVIVAGEGNNTSGELDWIVVSYDNRDGSLLWQDQIVVDGWDFVRSMAVNESLVFVAGDVTDNVEFSDWLVRAYDLR